MRISEAITWDLWAASADPENWAVPDNMVT